MSYIHSISNREQANELVNFYKENQPNGRHHCYAYRIGPEGKEYRSYDDGEPSGTAGKPILNQLLSKELTNVIVIIVRYSSGTKLGVSGLINAYKEATIDAINESKILEKPICKHYSMTFSYDQMPEIMKWSKQQKITFEKQNFDLQCNVEFLIDSSISEEKITTLPREIKTKLLFEG